MLLFFALLLPISMVAMEQNNGVFSFKLQDVTVKDIFKYIEKNSEYIFLYSTDKNLLKKINVDVNKKDITQVLDEILKNTTLIYDIDGKQIIIREKNASEKSQQKTTQKKKTWVQEAPVCRLLSALLRSCWLPFLWSPRCCHRRD